MILQSPRDEIPRWQKSTILHTVSKNTIDINIQVYIVFGQNHLNSKFFTDSEITPFTGSKPKTLASKTIVLRGYFCFPLPWLLVDYK